MNPDEAVLAQWWAHQQAHPGALPPGVEPVQTRLIRAVGRGRLPDAGPVHVKVMGFPRFKDRFRYAFQPFPAWVEYVALRRARALGILCPEPVAWRGLRRLGVPVASLLVTRSLPTRVGRPESDAVAAIAASLAAAGVEHCDLHLGNFVALEGGGAAVLDLHGARFRGSPPAGPVRVRMAAKLVADLLREPDGTAAAQRLVSCLVGAGFLPEGEVQAVLVAAERLRVAVLRDRIERCMHESTEFTRSFRADGVQHRRREARELAPAGQGGRELVTWWLGDRAREVLDGKPPLLAGLRRKWCWLPGQHHVYIPGPSPRALGPDQIQELLEGYARYRQLATATRDIGSRSLAGP